MPKADPVQIEPDAWCEWCGDPLPEKEERRPDKRFCSRKCGGAFRADLLRQARLDLRPERACDHCGTTFKAKGPANRFCSMSCQGKARYRRETGRAEDAGKSCARCGTAIPLLQTYCGPICRALMMRARGG